jgi:para-aminobenzoate synthetase component 1
MSTLLQQRTAPVVEPLAGLDAWDGCRRLARLGRVLFLDSADRSGGLGRYSYLMAEPFEWLEARNPCVRLNGNAAPSTDPLIALRQRLARCHVTNIPALPPFQGGAAGLFGYELCHHIERLPRAAFCDDQIPDLAVGLYDWVLSFDHDSEQAWLISTGLPETEPRRRLQRALQRRDQVLRWLDRGTDAASWAPLAPRRLEAPLKPVQGCPGLGSNFTQTEYLTTVQRAIDYIHAGDCFQVNVAQRLALPQNCPALDVYERLRTKNPAPFSAYFNLGRYAVASASPERFLHMQRGAVETRPIKGTRPRGATPDEDRARISELRASAKDRAENVMIVDLLRNDLGRVCEYGSVRVEALCRVESFPFVHHLVSEVRGRLRAGADAVDLLRATFPGGSVTGAPKVRAMEIIAELERLARGPYCGSLGYIGFDGTLDLSILIRTLILGDGWARFSVGGGIVADSIPQREYEETWHKARGVLQALADTV